MASTDTKSLDGDDPPDSPSNNSLESTMSLQSIGYSMHMYPFPSPPLPQQQPLRSKRRQVKNACTNCQKACKKCDDARPCLRCVKYGITEECIDSQRKERKKGIKRGPYKKRDGKDRAGSSVEQSDVSTQQDIAVSNSVPLPTSGSPPVVGPYMPMPGYFGQYPQAQLLKPVENGHLYHQYLAPVPQPVQLHGGSDTDHNGYQPQQYYQAFMPFGPPPVYPYMLPRQDGQISPSYMVFPMYPKVGGPHDMAAAGEQGRGSEDHDGTTDKAG